MGFFTEKIMEIGEIWSEEYEEVRVHTTAYQRGHAASRRFNLTI